MIYNPFGHVGMPGLEGHKGIIKCLRELELRSLWIEMDLLYGNVDVKYPRGEKYISEFSCQYLSLQFS